MDISISAEQLKNTAVHETAHAVMSVLKDLPCWGIFLQHEPNEAAFMFCTVIENGKPLGKSDYLQSAAGAAGELVFFGEYSYPETDKDRMIFAESGAPSWEQTVEEARIILTEEREKIQRLGSLVEDKVRYAPDSAVRTRRMNGDTRLFRELVNAGKLYNVLGCTAPPKVVAWLRAQIGRS
jgi:hypothetical protein